MALRRGGGGGCRSKRGNVIIEIRWRSAHIIIEIRWRSAHNRLGIIIEIRWRSAHKGIEGNEKADEWAKLAAEELDTHGVERLSYSD